MIPTRNFNSRYAATARRTLIARQAALLTLVLIPGVACGGSNDAEVFESARTPTSVESTTTPALTVPETSSETGATAVPGTTQPETTEPAATTGADREATTTATIPESGELVVSFTFAPSSTGGRILNPYIAVWIEDADGNLVRTISLWYEQSSKGARYLSDLRAWATASGQTIDTATSGATRVAGDYTVVWDGTDLSGEPVAQGDYVLYIEAAREHGPYEITSSPIAIGADGFTVALDDNGELTGATAQLVI